MRVCARTRASASWPLPGVAGYLVAWRWPRPCAPAECPSCPPAPHLLHQPPAALEPEVFRAVQLEAYGGVHAAIARPLAEGARVVVRQPQRHRGLQQAHPQPPGLAPPEPGCAGRCARQAHAGRRCVRASGAPWSWSPSSPQPSAQLPGRRPMHPPARPPPRGRRSRSAAPQRMLWLPIATAACRMAAPAGRLGVCRLAQQCSCSRPRGMLTMDACEVWRAARAGFAGRTSPCNPAQIGEIALWQSQWQ